ncbi:MAG: NADH-quinone oxidoreductase subunit L [Bdellovibrionales bacterium]|nr:NADH-quinone oxidoreductase subunit L [Bdellovibrionales bacterium]
MNEQLLIGLVIFAPFLGFLLNGFRFKSKNYKLAGTIASGAIFISFIGAVTLFLKLSGLEEASRRIELNLYNWMAVGDFSVNVSFVVDQISSIMILIITGIGTLIHIFSIGYMSHDERPTKYFAYLNLFIFNMLLLVLGSNLLIMFVGWEGVGLCSYLLIGFWFSDPEKAAAGMKAFITNRIGDAGFLLGIFLLFMTFGTLEFHEILGRLPEQSEMLWSGPLTLACLFLFVGAMGKSAQIPLYVWLPDAMAGPTPVSALIHAATMVTAGVYMIVRLNGLFMLAPNAMMVIAWTGALTAFFAASIGIFQNDIKKILAYSTVSQLGYMFLGVGVGAFGAGMFHLMTHAFFKALMFLGSGSVIHAMHEEQDVRKMGGLAKKMPITYFTFLMGWLAIIGMPPFAGFFSKDEILWYSFASPQGSSLLWLIGVVAAMMTAFYMTRLMALTFWGESRVSADVHPHESPISMTFPLMVLATLSVVGGWVGIPHVIGEILPGHPGNYFSHWLEPMVKEAELPHVSSYIEWLLMLISVMGAGLFAYLAYDSYLVHKTRPDVWAKKFSKTYHLVSNKYFVDEFYFSKIINPLVDISKGLWIYIDVNFIDKLTYRVSDFAKSIGAGFKSFQTGNLQQYAMYIAAGIVVTLSFILWGA